MKKIYARILPAILLIVVSHSSFAQNSFFSAANEASIQLTSAQQRKVIPSRYKTVGLEKQSLQNFLQGLPAETQVLYNRGQGQIMGLPMPDGSTARFRVWESSIQELSLQAKFPEIRTYAGQGIDDPTATIRFDYNPYFGFRAQILSSVTGRIYIDPYAKGNTDYYISYFHRDNRRATAFNCLTEDADVPGFRGGNNTESAGPCRGTELRTYRLAVACNGEYAQAVGGGLAGPTHAAIVTSVNRITGVYEVELAIRMVLVANNNLIEYLDPATDPYTNTINIALLNSNIANTNAVIGIDNYDIGHIFTSNDNGVAFLGVVCTSSKAGGATGAQVLTGDGFDIDYVAHEMGHQFNAPHTFNSANCASDGGAYEPGGGTTIMAYAGICSAAENIQPFSDAIFHASSFDAISTFITTGNAANCGVVSATGNILPVITSMGTNGLSIPINTPFTLTGTATDANGDALTYNWEGWDSGPAGTWVSAGSSTTRPLFRTRTSRLTGSRTFPDSRVIAANYPGLAAPSAFDGLRGEVLPQVARPMKFRLTVRDNRAGGGGVVSGGEGCGTFSATFQVNAVGTVPFRVSVPNGGESWVGSTSQTITWDLAGTDVAPINVANVKISLSTDGGLTYPTVITASTPNDGSELVPVPNMPSTTARIKVEAIGNIFFDISDANLAITAAPAVFSFSSPAATTIACNAATSATVTLGTISTGGYVVPIVLSATAGVPAGTTVTFTPATVIPGNSTIVTLTNTNSLANGTYNITVTGISGVQTQTRVVTFIVSAGTAPTIVTGPANVIVCAGLNASFSVTTSGPAVTGYQWQSSPDGVTYSNISGATSNTYTATAVTAGLNNFRYRVLVTGQCGLATSTAAILTVQTAAFINLQPQNAVECVGNNAVFSVSATGTGLTYQWEFSIDGSAPFTTIAAATASTYTVNSVTLAQNNYRYRVIVSGTCPVPVTSAAATLSVGNAAAINSQPVSTTVCVGQTATFNVGATGSSLTYQWQQSIDGGLIFTSLTGANTATLTLASVIATQNGYRYRVNVFSCTSTPIVSSVAILTVNTLAAVNTQPTAVVLCEGTNAVFTVAAVGTGVAYQWQVSATGCGGTFTNVAGATSNTLTITATSASLNGYAYRVLATGICNAVTSNCVTLTVNTAIVITAQPTSTSTCLPTQTTASFSVVVSGTAPTYQWQVSTNAGALWTNISGANAATLNLTGLTASMTGYQYRVVLNGTCTTNLNSSAATLTVNTLVAITTQPSNKSLCVGSTTTFDVVATGSTITYQWQVSINGGGFTNIVNGGPYSGATTASLAVATTGMELNGHNYRVVVSGVPCGSVSSNPAALRVNPLPSAVLVSSGNRLTPYINSALFVTVSPVGTYTYQWFQNNQLVPGALMASFPINVDRLGQYMVQVTDANGCTATTNRVTISDSASNMVFVYPNPSKGQFQVRYYSASSSNAYSIRVYDNKGGRVFSKQFPIAAPYSRMDVNLNNASAGIYMLEVTDAQGKRLASSSVVVAR